MERKKKLLNTTEYHIVDCTITQIKNKIEIYVCDPIILYFENNSTQFFGLVVQLFQTSL